MNQVLNYWLNYALAVLSGSIVALSVCQMGANPLLENSTSMIIIGILSLTSFCIATFSKLCSEDIIKGEEGEKQKLFTESMTQV